MKENRKDLVKRICGICGNSFSARLKDIKRGYGKYCSRSCSAKAKHITSPNNQFAEDNPNWKNGISRNRYHYTKLYRIRHPEARKAELLVQKAIRSGKLKKQPCEICGERKVHAHHKDYSKPLEINWLCPIHHRMAHGTSC